MSLFDIFGDQLATKAVKNVARQPLCNIGCLQRSLSFKDSLPAENMGKTVSSGPVKPNEPIKKVGETKKTFLCNKGAVLPATPMQKALSPKNRNLMSAQKLICPNVIYNDHDEQNHFLEEMEFTKPSYKYDNYHKDVLDYLIFSEEEHVDPPSPSTPTPKVAFSASFDSCYEDDFFTDGSSDSIHYEEDNLPDLY